MIIHVNVKYFFSFTAFFPSLSIELCFICTTSAFRTCPCKNMVYHSPARDLYTRVHFNFTRRVLSARIQDPAAAPAADKIPAPGSRPTGTSNRPGQSRPSGNGTGAARSVGQSAGPGNSRTGGGSRPGGNANRQRPQGGGGRHTKGRKNFNKSESKEENSESEIEVEGTICAVLAGTMFKVRLPNGHEVAGPYFRQNAQTLY